MKYSKKDLKQMALIVLNDLSFGNPKGTMVVTFMSAFTQLSEDQVIQKLKQLAGKE